MRCRKLSLNARLIALVVLALVAPACQYEEVPNPDNARNGVNAGGQAGQQSGGESSAAGTAGDAGAAGDGGNSSAGAGGLTGACSEGARQCTGDTVQECQSSVWTDLETCPFACLEGACIGACNEGDSTCSGRQRLVCGESFAFAADETCDFVCREGACAGECVPGTRRCQDLQTQSCALEGTWQNGIVCDYLCRSGICMGQCKPGTSLCSGNQVKICDENGFFKDGELCDDLCLAGACAGLCEAGDKECRERDPFICDQNGTWQSAGATCENVCQNGECVGSCQLGESRCVGDTPELCQGNGNWVAQSPCDASCLDGACVIAIQKTSRAPTIDGNFDGDPWPGQRFRIRNVVLPSVSNRRDLDGSWRALWDETALYIIVDVKDDSLRRDSGFVFWKDDSVEIALDGDHSRGTTYDGKNDYQLLYALNETFVAQGARSLPLPAGIEFEFTTTADGYILETRLPWANFGITPGDKIGLEVGINDDDNGGERDGKLVWHGTTDKAWFDPSVMASVTLAP